MHEAAQRVVDPHRVEERQRPRLAARRSPRCRRRSRRRRRRGAASGNARARSAAVTRAAAELVAALEHVGVGDLLAAHPDLDGRAVVAHEVVELLEQVAAEEGRLGDGGGVDARPLELGEGALRARRRARRPCRSPAARDSGTGPAPRRSARSRSRRTARARGAAPRSPRRGARPAARPPPAASRRSGTDER